MQIAQCFSFNYFFNGFRLYPLGFSSVFSVHIGKEVFTVPENLNDIGIIPIFEKKRFFPLSSRKKGIMP